MRMRFRAAMIALVGLFLGLRLGAFDSSASHDGAAPWDHDPAAR